MKIAGIAAVVIGVGTLLLFLVVVLWPHPVTPPDMLHDLNSLRAIAHLTVAYVEREGHLPLRDGALDVYAVCRRFCHDETGETDMTDMPEILRSYRHRAGPTIEEIRHGDYANFPWARARALRRLPPDRVVALVWEREPDEEGRFLVATSKPAVRIVDAEELERLQIGVASVDDGRRDAPEDDHSTRRK